MTESGTHAADYTARLTAASRGTWRRIVDVQAPYRWHLRHLKLGRVLDVGCGIGRNLVHLDGNGVGVDHNPTSVAVARRRGLVAWTTQEWPGSADAVPGSFDTLLVAHVLEHVTGTEGNDLLAAYVPFVRPGGRVVLICPQERGYPTDPTHVRFVTPADLERHATLVGLREARSYSFPFPRLAGRVFTHNESVCVAVR